MAQYFFNRYRAIEGWNESDKFQGLTPLESRKMYTTFTDKSVPGSSTLTSSEPFRASAGFISTTHSGVGMPSVTEYTEIPTLSGSLIAGPNIIGKTGYAIEGATIRKVKLLSNATNPYEAQLIESIYRETSGYKTMYRYKHRGEFLDTIQGGANDYPTDGIRGNYWYVRSGIVNDTPTITDATQNNTTLYENDIINIKGTVKDLNKGDVVSVKYKINGGTARAIATGISDGVTPLAYNKSLKYTNKKLMDGTTTIIDNLAEGSQNTIAVWAEDDKGGKSAEVNRVFYVVHNRPPVLTILPFDSTGDLINSDTITINGTVSDPEGGEIIVKYRVGTDAFKEVYRGEGGEFQFQVPVSDLKEGKNQLTIQSEDSFGSMSSKILEVSKDKDVHLLNKSVVRYDITPQNGSAKGLVLWVQMEDGDLNVEAEISMTGLGDAEDFKPMTKNLTAYVSAGIVEDEFVYEVPEGVAKEKIILKLTMERENVESTEGITLISGVLS